MLKVSSEHRPRQLLAVYIEQRRLEILRAHRQWRSWEIDSVEDMEIPEGEPIFDYLQRLNLRPVDRSKTTLLLFLPLLYYTTHHEHYPAALSEQLDEAIGFDWPENVFLEADRTLHFSGQPVTLNHHLSVPIFTLQREIYDKFSQVLGTANFQSFRIIPTAMTYQALTSPDPGDESSPLLEVLARIVGPSHIEVHRFYNGRLLDSLLLGNHHDSLRLFLETIRGTGNGSFEGEATLRLVCSDGDTMAAETFRHAWGAMVPVEIQILEEPLVSCWVKYLFDQDRVKTFDAPIFLKPWKAPRIVWPLLAMVLLYTLFFGYQVWAHRHLLETSHRLKGEIAHLETQWKPIEQLQTRISKFQEDQKTLSQFNQEGYPVLEILTLLTQITPDDTWLNYFSLRKGQIILRGESKSAVKYLSELSKIDGFGDVKFASPVTRSPSSDMERFNVQFQADMEKLKKVLAALPPEEGPEPEGPGQPLPPLPDSEARPVPPPALERDVSAPPPGLRPGTRRGTLPSLRPLEKRGLSQRLQKRIPPEGLSQPEPEPESAPDDETPPEE